MTELPTGTRTGAHRARPTPLRTAAPVLALVLAFLLGGAAFALRPDGSAPTAGTESPSAGPGQSSQSTPTASVTASGAPSPDGETAAPSASPSESPEAVASAPSGTINVVVLNASGVAGLARAVADDLEAAGWGVTSLGNLADAGAASTVYYPDGFEAEAELLARAVPGEQVTAPVTADFASDHLTLVLVEDVR